MESDRSDEQEALMRTLREVTVRALRARAVGDHAALEVLVQRRGALRSALEACAERLIRAA